MCLRCLANTKETDTEIIKFRYFVHDYVPSVVYANVKHVHRDSNVGHLSRKEQYKRTNSKCYTRMHT